jgi:pyruvate/2-oxoacid:ferredoxin oxidoreductase alpha subunit/NAD-dependent dihydropyrimidine dehydrogenase PreA subunit
MAPIQQRARPALFPDYCKGCGRCIEACAYHSILAGADVHPATGLVPVHLDLEHCTGCGLCFDACPEPYALRPAFAEISAADGAPRHAGAETSRPVPVSVPDARIPLPRSEPLVIKGMYASAIGAILAGCRHFFGYPITPSTEGAELMAKLLPHLDGAFVQAVSEVAAINMLYGAGAAGIRATTFTSSPGFSLMLEGLSYMVGAHLPGVVVNVMRGGPGLGNIAPEQADIKLVCRGLGHGNTHAIVLAPSTPQEMLDLTMEAFELSFKYRNPVIVLADGYLAQMTGRVTLPGTMVRPGVPGWAVTGDEAHRRNLICSIHLGESDLETANLDLNEKYRRIASAEQRAHLFHCDDADVLIVACNTPARMATGAVRTLRSRGIKAGLFRPITIWPFPIDSLAPLLAQVRQVVVVEASPGQLEDEMRLAASRAGVTLPSIDRVNRLGGVLPSQEEIVARVPAAMGAVP